MFPKYHIASTKEQAQPFEAKFGHPWHWSLSNAVAANLLLLFLHCSMLG